MDEEMIVNAINLIFSMITANTPVDTRNLLNHTTMSLYGNKATIEITAPKVTANGKDDYAQYVNYLPTTRGGNANKNYHYIERAILQACEIVASRVGGVVINEL